MKIMKCILSVLLVGMQATVYASGVGGASLASMAGDVANNLKQVQAAKQQGEEQAADAKKEQSRINAERRQAEKAMANNPQLQLKEGQKGYPIMDPFAQPGYWASRGTKYQIAMKSAYDTSTLTNKQAQQSISNEFKQTQAAMKGLGGILKSSGGMISELNAKQEQANQVQSTTQQIDDLAAQGRLKCDKVNDKMQCWGKVTSFQGLDGTYKIGENNVSFAQIGKGDYKHCSVNKDSGAVSCEAQTKIVESITPPEGQGQCTLKEGEESKYECKVAAQEFTQPTNLAGVSWNKETQSWGAEVDSIKKFKGSDLDYAVTAYNEMIRSKKFSNILTELKNNPNGDVWQCVEEDQGALWECSINGKNKELYSYNDLMNAVQKQRIEQLVQEIVKKLKGNEIELSKLGLKAGATDAEIIASLDTATLDKQKELASQNADQIDVCVSKAILDSQRIHSIHAKQTSDLQAATSNK